MADGTYLDGYYTGWMSVAAGASVPIRPAPPEGRFASYEEGFHSGQDDALAWLERRLTEPDGRGSGPDSPPGSL